MSSADLVQRKGFGSALCWSMKAVMSASSADDAAMDAAPDLALGDEREEALDLIEPGCAGGRQMHMPARPLGQPVADQRGLVGGVVVHDQMHVEIAGDGCFDLVEEIAELAGAVARIALADDGAGGDVERGEQRRRAMALIVVASPRRPGQGASAASAGCGRAPGFAIFSSTHNTMARSGGDM